MMIRSVLEIYLKDIRIAWIGVNGVSDREMNMVMLNQILPSIYDG
jgi:hypothetical protein